MNDVKFKSLLNLLKLFKNRPHHLAKYLIDNNALNEEFISDLLSSGLENDDVISDDLNFKTIDEMEDFYLKLMYYEIHDDEKKSLRKIEQDLNKKLQQLLAEDKYEDAATLRDYMKRKKIKINR